MAIFFSFDSVSKFDSGIPKSKRGAAGVREHYSVSRMASRALDVYAGWVPEDVRTAFEAMMKQYFSDGVPLGQRNRSKRPSLGKNESDSRLRDSCSKIELFPSSLRLSG